MLTTINDTDKDNMMEDELPALKKKKDTLITTVSFLQHQDKKEHKST